MSNIKWDHTVHYVNDLNEPEKQFNDAGIKAFFGGSHTQWGTNNSLSYFGLTYLEFLAVEDREKASTIEEPNQVIKDAVSQLPDHEGLSRVALRTDNIEDLRERFVAHNIEVSPVMPGKRYNAKGQLIEWKMMTISGDFEGLPYPFILEWKGTDEEREQQLKENGVISEHPVGRLELKEAVFQVRDPENTVKHWQEIFGFEHVSEQAIQLEDKQFTFKKSENVGLHELVFLADVNQSIEFSGGEYRLVNK